MKNYGLRPGSVRKEATQKRLGRKSDLRQHPCEIGCQEQMGLGSEVQGYQVAMITTPRPSEPGVPISLESGRGKQTGEL